MYFSYIKIRLKIMLYIVLILSIFMLYITIKHLEFGLLLIVFSLILIFCILTIAKLLFFGVYSSRFYIDEEGVKFFKRKEIFSIKWENINFVGLTSYTGFINKNSSVYFDSRPLIDNVYRGREPNYYQYSNEFFGVQYRKKVLKEVKKYWNGPIQGIYQIEGKES